VAFWEMPCYTEYVFTYSVIKLFTFFLYILFIHVLLYFVLYLFVYLLLHLLAH
jgi:hypothetical protein